VGRPRSSGDYYDLIGVLLSVCTDGSSRGQFAGENSLEWPFLCLIQQVPDQDLSLSTEEVNLTIGFAVIQIHGWAC
jgi:hypothetical protein